MNIADEVDYRRRVGENIVLARSLADVSGNWLAKRADISRARLSDYEHGRIEPSHRTLRRVAAALGRPLGWFYDPHDESLRCAPASEQPPAQQPPVAAPPTAAAPARTSTTPTPYRTTECPATAPTARPTGG